MFEIVRRGRGTIATISVLTVAAGAALTTGSPAVADSAQGASATSDHGPVVPTGDAVRGEAWLSRDDASSADEAGRPQLYYRDLPYNCKAQVDYPHNSHTVSGTINVHFDTNCGAKAPNLSTEGSLSRSRWYGWEHLTTRKGSKHNSYKLRVTAPKGCKKGTLYRYKGQARFYVSGPRGNGSASVYNQNDTEIKCTG